METYANATGRLVKKPNRMLARPDSAAVAVMRSCLTTGTSFVRLSCSSIALTGKKNSHRPRRIATRPHLHISRLHREVSRRHKVHQFPRGCWPKPHVSASMIEPNSLLTYVDGNDIRHGRKRC